MTLFIFGASAAFAQISFGGGIDLTLVPMQVAARDMLEYENNVWFGAGAGEGEMSGICPRISL
jgi:hypothetical protein